MPVFSKGMICLPLGERIDTRRFGAKRIIDCSLP